MRHALVRSLVVAAVVTVGLGAMPATATAQSAEPKAEEKKPEKAPRRPRGDRNKLTRVEIDEGAAGMVTARDAVRMLRPQWLQPPVGRSGASTMGGESGGATDVVVYIDDMRQPDLESLITVPIAKVFEIRYLDQNRAIQMRGPGHEKGVIEVTTVDKRK